jgi:cyclopropane fatty-acyl-phospholipid synthase-like methyltransferase
VENINLIGYASPLKVVAVGKILGFNSDTKVIDFGCGRGDVLNLWGRYFGVNGIGIEACSEFCEIVPRMYRRNSADMREISIQKLNY